MSDWNKRFREGFMGKKEDKEKTDKIKSEEERHYLEYLAAKKEQEKAKSQKGYQEGGIIMVKQEAKKIPSKDAKKLKESFKNIKKILKKQ